ncbi:sugar-binding protein [Pseudomonas sp. HY2-MNA-CIBAN-0224]|uniref:sugar-binding protein n=3 Tax=unclassified Pseudomonas TaxID=196821 RepID=UPI003325BBB1
MSTSTSVHSNAFNFMSYIQGQVDPRTGQYTCAITLPELKANNLCGPVVPLQLNFNPLNNSDSGFGIGWNLQLSQYNPNSRVLSLYTGETFKVNLEETPEGIGKFIPEKKIDSFHFYILDDKHYRIEHKSGLIEILEVGQGGLAMPVQMLSPQGHSVTLQYTPFFTEPLLSSIKNADGTELISLLRTNNELKILLHPGTVYEAEFKLEIIGSETRTIVLPTDDNASWRFVYGMYNDLTCLTSVDTPTGGHETITYSAAGHSFPGLSGRKLPRVQIHKRDPGFDQPVSETRYEYDSQDRNFLGFGSGIAWSDDGLDNLYKISADYQYETTENVWDATRNQTVRSTHRVFNKYHLLVSEQITQKAEAGSEDTLSVTETKYYIDPQKNFKDQPAYCQLPKTVTKIWRNANATEPRHTETVTATYDDYGNLLTQTNANGVIETNTWYSRDGEADSEEGHYGCPADPQKFVRSLKSKTVTPAASGFGSAPTLQTRYRYDEYLGLKGASPWLVMGRETLTESGTILHSSTFDYIETPDDALDHGRKLQDAVTRNGMTTTTQYLYSQTFNLLAGETVLHTVNTVIGYDDVPGVPDKQVRKVFTLEHSLLNGQPLLNRDDNDVEIAYEYDLLGRVTKETVSPNNEAYKASRNYTYQLTGSAGQQAIQTAEDVKGVKTITYLDGHNRVVKEERRNADADGKGSEKYRDIYRASYNHLEQMTSETVIDWEKEKDIELTSLFNYDAWGEQRSVIRPDGVEEHEVTDPVKRTTTQWVEGMGKTVTTHNLFDKPDSIKRINLKNNLVSEQTYNYDGLGRTAEEYDAAGNWTRYEYDAFERMTKTILPDGYEIEREYAQHNSEDLPIKISVNGLVLGEQVFDGLDRMTVSITGGRKSIYSFEPGQMQPCKVVRPTGLETTFEYRPELGEEPVQRGTGESTAIYEYDPQNARLLSTEESGKKLIRSYFSTGELKSETHAQEGTVPLNMHYEYSRQARLLTYVDVLGQTQTYDFDEYARLTATELGTTRSVFTYNSVGLQAGIETIDGAQRLKIDLAYDDFGREVLRTFDLGGGVVQTLEQTYDAVDRLTQRTLKQGEDVLRSEGYDYDARGRLYEYTCTGSQAPVDPYGKIIKTQLFGFDAQDNITFVETTYQGGAYTSEYEYEYDDPKADPCQLKAVTHTFETGAPQRIEFSYDADGNLLNDEAGRILAYDNLGRLTSVSI